MKKKLEADLMSIAHRVLQMKNKSDINQLCIEAQRLYEKLSVLRFVEEHFGGTKPTIGQAEVVEKMKQFFEENRLTDVKPAMSKIEIVTEIVADEDVEDLTQTVAEDQKSTFEEITAVVAPDSSTADIDETEANETGQTEEIAAEKIAEIKSKEIENISFVPAFELDLEEEKTAKPTKKESPQISFEELLGSDYSDTLFVKLEKNEDSKKPPIDFELPIANQKMEQIDAEVVTENNDSKTVSLNDKLSHGITIGLNDRIGFVKNLFGNSEEDYTRVLNQLITYDSVDEAKSFIADMVKPDYDDWNGKEEYAQRFIEMIEKKFA